MSEAGAPHRTNASRRRLFSLLVLGLGVGAGALWWPTDPVEAQIRALAAAFTRVPAEGHDAWAARLEAALAGQLHRDARLHFEQRDVVSGRQAILARVRSWQASRKAWFVRIERIEFLTNPAGDAPRRARVSTTQSDTDHGELHGELRDIELAYELQGERWWLVEARVGSAAQGPPEERP